MEGGGGGEEEEGEKVHLLTHDPLGGHVGKNKYLGYKNSEKIIVMQLSIFLDALTNRGGGGEYITKNICKKLRNKSYMLMVVNPPFIMQSKILRY